MNATPKLDSPCIDVCTLDSESGYCVGCFRTIDEIAAWSVLSEADRGAVLARLPGRRSKFHDQLDADPRRPGRR